jgi:hypothetical protein
LQQVQAQQLLQQQLTAQQAAAAAPLHVRSAQQMCSAEQS